jgi:hypothetical protein
MQECFCNLHFWYLTGFHDELSSYHICCQCKLLLHAVAAAIASAVIAAVIAGAISDFV